MSSFLTCCRCGDAFAAEMADTVVVDSPNGMVPLADEPTCPVCQISALADSMAELSAGQPLAATRNQQPEG